METYAGRPPANHLSCSDMKSAERLLALAPSCTMAGHKGATMGEYSQLYRLDGRLFCALTHLVNPACFLGGEMEREGRVGGKVQ
jgi:hypothetical protein